ncbi:MAG: ABC transporter permease [Geminicoccales bacterium]
MKAVLDPVVTQAEATDVAPSAESPSRRFWSDFFESRIATLGLVAIVLIMLAALFASWIAPQDPYDLGQVSVLDSRLPPGETSMDGYTFWLGTDGAGRDLWSAILYGLRISLSVGVMSAFIALLTGMVVGLVAAYAGGRTDALIMRVVDLQLSFPAVLVALMLLAILGKGIDKIIFALIVAQWAYYARTVRGSALVERSKDYVEAAACLGLSHSRILFRHILPNCLPPLIVVGTVQTAHAIALEATLSFLGVGVPVTQPSLGTLIRIGNDFLFSGEWWMTIFPGIALVVLVLAVNLLGDWLRDALNPRLR